MVVRQGVTYVARRTGATNTVAPTWNAKQLNTHTLPGVNLNGYFWHEIR